MASHRLVLLLLALLLGAGLGGCVVPKGQPVVVDSRAGDFWIGYGTLLERSPDGERCRVAVRSRALIVERPWVPCRYVHLRTREP